ncbi:MAG: hypothetical protein B0A82_05390 [Alkalinema sp. CACIAM 70d]|uniref:hypothetical protein n=1 Tax=Alkalinema TaxID=1620700 RepID=UPI000B645AF4|nr:hypothetical protein [Alkalinema sp. FACHB-956]MBD2329376.1 hypothetical protein [Alkalinema sp. FACHB-956]OUC15702.1 MAG: hypothetical protein B0A82_05390 [Alkalinema sp. CACIAM 70d]
MAKRRNQKKEKALRNLAYARKFRKRTNTGRHGRRRFDDNRLDEQEQEAGKGGAEEATAE